MQYVKTLKSETNETEIWFFFLFSLLILWNPCCFFFFCFFFFVSFFFFYITIHGIWHFVHIEQASQEIPQPPRRNTITQFHFHEGGTGFLQRVGGEGRGGARRGNQETTSEWDGRSSQSRSVHTYQSYIISIIWRRKSIQADRALQEYKCVV